jgi:hypothetical protein
MFLLEGCSGDTSPPEPTHKDSTPTVHYTDDNSDSSSDDVGDDIAEQAAIDMMLFSATQ